MRDKEGKENHKDVDERHENHFRTTGLPPYTTSPVWDEVFTLGLQGNFSHMLNIAIESPGVTGNYKLGEVFKYLSHTQHHNPDLFHKVTILLARLVAALRLTKVD